jgi:fumarate reductase flavoprotein subunit
VRKINVISFVILLLIAYGNMPFITSVYGIEQPKKAQIPTHFLSDRHEEYDSCIACHNEKKPSAGALVSMEQCLLCHGEWEELAERTKAFEDNNPHRNHLNEIECSLCHKGHEESSLFCASCHEQLNAKMK